ncbi:MAG: glutamine amidotransferase-related protein [Thermoleophilia bacterium]
MTRAAPRIVVLEHSPRAPLGALERVLAAGAELITVRGCGGPPEVEMEAAALVADLIADGTYDGLIALGGSMGVYEQQQYACLSESLRLVGDAVRREVPILGLGLGSQLLAESLGSPVFQGSGRGLPEEMGFMPLYLTKQGGSDAAMRIFATSEPQLFWHRDTHDVPEEAVHLASTAVYHTAAFRWGRWSYGFQFHAEATAGIVEQWAEEDAIQLKAQDIDRRALVAQAWMLDDLIQEKADRLAELFLSWVRERSPRL